MAPHAAKQVGERSLRITPSAESVGVRHELPKADIRVERDRAVGRAWRELGRRLGRGAILLGADTTAAVAAMAAGLLAMAPSASAPTALPLVLPLLILQPLVFHSVGAYRDGTNGVSLRRVPRGVILAAALAWAQAVALGADAGLTGAGAVYAVYAGLGALLILAGRLAVRGLVRLAHRRGIGQRRVLAIGTEDDVTDFFHGGRSRLTPDMRIVGRLSCTATAERGAIGTIAELDRALRETSATGVIITSTLPFEDFETLVRRAFKLGVSVTVVPRTIQKLDGTRLVLRQAAGGSLMQLSPQGLRVPQLALKRAMDLVLTAVGLLAIAPVMALIALAIKLDSRGPVLFRQTRAGVGGQPFTMYKFRTMVADADAMKQQLQDLNESGDPRLFKIKNDPRITRVGRLLRKTSLDELPQLFNVLKGDMSLVGPRPFFPGDLADYEDHHFERLFVLPGITGLWQVSGRSDVVDFEEVVRLDSTYIRNWSIAMDLSILARTLPAALGRGAY